HDDAPRARPRQGDARHRARHGARSAAPHHRRRALGGGSHAPMVTRTLTRVDATHWRLSGEVDADEARAIGAALSQAALTSAITLDLGELELDSGVACGLLVEAIRGLLARGVSVTLVEA